MNKVLKKLRKGYERFRTAHAIGTDSLMKSLAQGGQNPEVMVVACSDSRVDPALLLQSLPGELFVVRNVANIIPPYEADGAHHGTSAALEFGVCYIHVNHLIILGHSQCGGIQAMLSPEKLHQNDFISNWTDINKDASLHYEPHQADDCAKASMKQSFKNCLSFPWINSRVDEKKLEIHCWFFDIQQSRLFELDFETGEYLPLK
jgi:carbonic anhydrase